MPVEAAPTPTPETIPEPQAASETLAVHKEITAMAIERREFTIKFL
jgi:hypothetical protein